MTTYFGERITKARAQTLADPVKWEELQSWVKQWAPGRRPTYTLHSGGELWAEVKYDDYGSLHVVVLAESWPWTTNPAN